MLRLSTSAIRQAISSSFIAILATRGLRHYHWPLDAEVRPSIFAPSITAGIAKMRYRISAKVYCGLGSRHLLTRAFSAAISNRRNVSLPELSVGSSSTTLTDSRSEERRVGKEWKLV